MPKPADESDKKHGDPLESAVQNIGSGSKQAAERKESEDDDLEEEDDDLEEDDGDEVDAPDDDERND